MRRTTSPSGHYHAARPWSSLTRIEDYRVVHHVSKRPENQTPPHRTIPHEMDTEQDWISLQAFHELVASLDPPLRNVSTLFEPPKHSLPQRLTKLTTSKLQMKREQLQMERTHQGVHSSGFSATSFFGGCKVGVL
eukprot:5826878-Amphidinium_carterae.1